MDGKPIPLQTLYMWIAAGWNVLEVIYRGNPTVFGNAHSMIGSNLEKEVDDCHKAVTEEVADNSHTNILLMGVEIGGTISANLAAKYPNIYGHIILVNPILSLPALIVSRPNYLKRIFNPDRNVFTPLDVSRIWKASPLSQVEDIHSAVLLITSWNLLNTQAAVLDRKLGDNGVSSEYYQVEQGDEDSLDTIAMMVKWAEKHHVNYTEQCFVPEEITTVASLPEKITTVGSLPEQITTLGSLPEQITTLASVPEDMTTLATATTTMAAASEISVSLSKEIKNFTKEIKKPVDKEITAKTASSSSKSVLTWILVVFIYLILL